MSFGSKNKNRFRDWLKPALFTATLYIALAGGYFFYAKMTDKSAAPPANQSTIPPSNVNTATIDGGRDANQTTATVAPVTVEKTVTDVMLIAESGNEQNANARIFATTPNTQTVAKSPSKKLIAQSTQPPADLLESAPQEQAPIVLPQNESITQTATNNSKESVALTKAEAEAEEQNELLREAINKVRTLNDSKIAKSQSIEESEVVLQPSTNKDESEQQENTFKQDLKPPKIEKQEEKVVINQDVSVDVGDVETTETE